MNMMKENGTGGANTQTGKEYEGKVDLVNYLNAQPGYKVSERVVLFKGKKVKMHVVLYKDQEIAIIFKKRGLATFLKQRNIDWENYVSRLLQPDNCLYVPETNTIFIIECKTQKVKGSVDEKLQTCDFKLEYYTHLLEDTKLKVEFVFLLDKKWFASEENWKKYQDVYKYIEERNCRYFFDVIPLKYLGLPTLGETEETE